MLFSPIVLLADLLCVCFVFPVTCVWKFTKVGFIRGVCVFPKAGVIDKKGKTRKERG